MGKTSTFLQLYKKIYGCEIPTREKIENVKLINGLTQILSSTEIYNMTLRKRVQRLTSYIRKWKAWRVLNL